MFDMNVGNYGKIWTTSYSFLKGLRFVTADRCHRSGSNLTPDTMTSPGESQPTPTSSDTPVGLNGGCFIQERNGGVSGEVGGGAGGAGGGGGLTVSSGGLCVEAVEVEGFAVGDAVKHRIISSRLRKERSLYR